MIVFLGYISAILWGEKSSIFVYKTRDLIIIIIMVVLNLRKFDFQIYKSNWRLTGKGDSPKTNNLICEKQGGITLNKHAEGNKILLERIQVEHVII